MSLTRSCHTRTMARSLARSSSVSLVLPLAPQHQSTILCTLRRAQSSIPAIGGRPEPAADFPKLNKSFQQLLLPSGDSEQDSHCGDYSSCDSSLADYLELVEEPQRVSKDILRSLSTSFRWLEIPFHGSELPWSNVESDDTSSPERPLSSNATSVKSISTSFKWLEVPFYESELPVSSVDAIKSEPVARSSHLNVVKNDISHVYIHECLTGKSMVNHVEVKVAMDSLGHWNIQVPMNCCLSYRHEISGEVATLPWPDMEAGGAEEIEEFVRAVNRMEERPVFFPRYGRSPYYPLNSKPSIPPPSPRF